MSKVEDYTKWIEAIADDNSHGYSQYNRWGTPDYDCSSLIISALETNGIPAKTKGATYTGNMLPVLLTLGFIDVIAEVNLRTGAGLKRGDILLNTSHHVEVYIGNGRVCGAKISETGKIYGKAGDQTGREITRSNYYNYPWNHILRYKAEINEQKVGDFIERLYKNTLNRNSDAPGKAYWIDKAKNGATGAALAYGFLLSPEFIKNSSNMSHTQYVELLYRTFFNRNSDPIGLKHWTDLLYTGVKREIVIEGFIGSTEWRDLCRTYGIEPN
jgi:hypothetical protein